MSDDKIYPDPSEVTVDDGVVHVKGPDAVDVRMTPEAADETSERLLYGAMHALGQKVTGDAGRKRKPDAPEPADPTQPPGPPSDLG